VVYKYDQQDSLIAFHPWFMIPGKSSCPLNKTVYLSDDMVKIIYDVKNTSNTLDDEMVGKYWTMKPEGLELAQRKPVTTQNNKKPKK